MWVEASCEAEVSDWKRREKNKLSKQGYSLYCDPQIKLILPAFSHHDGLFSFWLWAQSNHPSFLKLLFVRPLVEWWKTVIRMSLTLKALSPLQEGSKGELKHSISVGLGGYMSPECIRIWTGGFLSILWKSVGEMTSYWRQIASDRSMIEGQQISSLTECLSYLLFLLLW